MTNSGRNWVKKLEGVGLKEFTEWHINNFPGERVCQSGEVLLEHQLPQLKSITFNNNDNINRKH